jgi:hypothetical protein
MLKHLALVALALAIVAPAAHGSAQDVIRDCSEDGILNGHYSHSELTKALNQLPSDIDEYTDCRAVIRSAQLKSASGKKDSSVPATAAPTPTEQNKVAQASKSPGPVNVGGKGVVPGASGAPFKAAGFGTDLPTFVLITLVLLLLMMVGAAVLAIQRRPGLAGSPVIAPFYKLAGKVRDGIARFRR